MMQMSAAQGDFIFQKAKTRDKLSASETCEL